MLAVQSKEVRDRHYHLVLTPDEVCFLEHIAILDPLTALIELNAVVDGVRDRREGLLVP